MQNKSDFKILAIDDDKDILLLLRYNLESEGYHVETASSGKKGISIAQKSDPDLILIDIMMHQLYPHIFQKQLFFYLLFLNIHNQ